MYLVGSLLIPWSPLWKLAGLVTEFSEFNETFRENSIDALAVPDEPNQLGNGLDALFHSPYPKALQGEIWSG